MSNNNDNITKTSNERGKYGEKYFEGVLIENGLEYINVSDIEEYQHEDVDFIAIHNGKQSKIEVKLDAISPGTGNFPYELVCQMVEYQKNILEKALEKYRVQSATKPTFKGTFEEIYTNIVESLKFPKGCCIKTKADCIAVVNVDEIKGRNSFKLTNSTKCGHTYAIRAKKLHNFVRSKEFIFKISDHEESGVAKYNFILLVPYRDLEKEKIAERRTPECSKWNVFNEYHTVNELIEILKKEGKEFA